MYDANPELVAKHLSIIRHLASEFKNGNNGDAEFSRAIADAIDFFALVYNPGAQLEHFISQLKFMAEQHPESADVLLRAASVASRASTEPEA